jgi:TRAP-type C4-dicarboxylate transport system substrate-binding protein
MTRKRLAAAALVAATVLCGCAGASSAGDKAGGSRPGQVVLRFPVTGSNVNDALPVAYFLWRLAALSHGDIQVKVVNEFGGYGPAAEVQTVRAVASGTFDLASVGSRVFDSMGVPSFQALSAPMLIDSNPLEEAVLNSGIPDRMLIGLRRLNVTGVGVLGDALRVPIGAHRPLLSPGQWRGVSFGTYRSGIQEQAIRALGAKPVEAFGALRLQYLEAGAIQAFELDVRRYVRNGLVATAPYVVANVVLWPQIDVLFANPAWLASLTTQQRGWIRQAAEDARRHSVALASTTEANLKEACAMGATFASATPADLSALRRAEASVYQQIEHDPQTKAFVQEIENLKPSTPPGPALRLPPGCRRLRSPP